MSGAYKSLEIILQKENKCTDLRKKNYQHSGTESLVVHTFGILRMRF
jgi:hypothetical protein